MNTKDFRKYGHELIDWMADYMENIESYPVRSQVEPKEIIRQIPEAPPKAGEAFEKIMADFNKIIMPGMTHWQHPAFHAYFTGNGSPPSILAEMLTATLGAQCMIWQTSPAAAELEERMMEWLRDLIGLPKSFSGVIQDTASTATLCAILTAREMASGFRINNQGFYDQSKFIVYCSAHTHSSIAKAVKIAGLGEENLRQISVDDVFAMQPEKLAAVIEADLAAGLKPLCAISTIGTTSSTAVDPVDAIGEICQRYSIWHHVDAAFAGTALMLPEMARFRKGFDKIDTFVFNPHKWMFTNFDCTAYFVKDKGALIRTFEILPEYLKTKEGSRVNNYRDWGIPLGRRFRALKLWFVIRSYGVSGLQEKIRAHVSLAQDFAQKIEKSDHFELLAPTPFNTVCFRFKPPPMTGLDEINALNSELLENLNATGQLYMTHTKLNGIYTIRIVIGQTYVEKRHVDNAWVLLNREAEMLLSP